MAMSKSASVSLNLPEVESIAHGLGKRVSGDTIEAVWLDGKPGPLKSRGRRQRRRAGSPPQSRNDHIQVVRLFFIGT